MIISASRRTDIPAFYSEWMMQRLRAGYCTVTNPFRPSQSRKISLAAKDVSALIFWTRWSKPLQPYVDEIAKIGHQVFFLYTITGYGSQLEPGVPALDRQIDDLQNLAHRIGADRIAWRYDPILFTERRPPDYHADHFTRLADKIAPLCHRAIISLFDPYRNVLRRLDKSSSESMMSIEEDELFGFLQGLAVTAKALQLPIYSCSESPLWEKIGIVPGKCIDDDWIFAVTGRRVCGSKDPGQRQACRCVKSIDIGRYDTCGHGCLYCYATQHPDRAAVALQQHNPALDHL
ncbi:MAG TPA: DUF1848 domain-containing protein [bacterium]|nr:DUF1848 domain-containing protein [bacterium]